MSRPDSDLVKLHDAVNLFRASANLHGHSKPAHLIAWAHGSGRSKKGAEMVRTCWHDFETACRMFEIPVTRYEPGYPPAQKQQHAAGAEPRRRDQPAQGPGQRPQGRSARTAQPAKSKPRTAADGGIDESLLF